MSDAIGSPPQAPNDALLTLYEEIADCPACELARHRTQTVPGVGPAPAEVMCIGEAPGAREDIATSEAPTPIAPATAAAASGPSAGQHSLL